MSFILITRTGRPVIYGGQMARFQSEAHARLYAVEGDRVEVWKEVRHAPDERS